MTRGFPIAMTIALAAACSELSDPVDLGDSSSAGEAGQGGSGEASAGQGAGSGDAGAGPVSAGHGGDISDGGAGGHDALGDEIADFEGSWDGYVEGENFLDGTSRLRFTLPPNEGVGTLVFGDSEPPAPAEDAEVFPYKSPEGEPWVGQSRLIPGYEYPALVMLQDGAITLIIDRHDPMREFCELQTPILDTVNTWMPIYNCIPNEINTWDHDTNECTITQDETPIDCGKLFACDGGGCGCEQDGCTSSRVEEGVLELSLEDAQTLIGTLGDDQLSVRLSRTP